MKKTIFLLCLSLGVAFAFDINALAKANLDKKGVYEQVLDSKPYYVVYTRLKNRFNDRESKLAQKAVLYAKADLFEFLKKQDKKLVSLSLSQATNSSLFKNGEFYSLVLVVDKDKVQKNYQSKAGQESFSQKDLQTLYKEQAKALEESFKQDEKLETLKELKELYFKLGDIDNFDRIENLILEKEFEL